MDYINLGKSGLHVSRMCLGSLTVGPLCADLSAAEGGKLILKAFELGITFVDTAEQYRTYPHIAEALRQYEKRDEIIISTKTFAETDEQASWAIEDARLALNRNILDIMLLHEVRDMEDFVSRSAAWEVIKTAKKNGFIRAIGLSTHSAAVADWAGENEDIDIIHAMLNVSGIGILDGSREDMLQALSKAKQNGKGIFSMKALGGGALMHDAHMALDWARERTEIHAIAIGCRDEKELITDIGWMEGIDPPEAKEIRLLDRNMAFDKEPRCHGCGKCVERCSTGAMRLENGEAVWDKSKCVYCGYCIAACPWFCLSFC